MLTAFAALITFSRSLFDTILYLWEDMPILASLWMSSCLPLAEADTEKFIRLDR